MPKGALALCLASGGSPGGQETGRKQFPALWRGSSIMIQTRTETNKRRVMIWKWAKQWCVHSWFSFPESLCSSLYPAEKSHKFFYPLSHQNLFSGKYQIVLFCQKIDSDKVGYAYNGNFWSKEFQLLMVWKPRLLLTGRENYLGYKRSQSHLN